MEAAIARDADALCKLIDAHFRETTTLISTAASQTAAHGARESLPA